MQWEGSPVRRPCQVKGNSRHALHLSGYIQFMQSQLPCGFAVADTIIELFRDNRVVLEGLPEEVVDGFVRHMDRCGCSHMWRCGGWVGGWLVCCVLCGCKCGCACVRVCSCINLNV